MQCVHNNLAFGVIRVLFNGIAYKKRKIKKIVQNYHKMSICVIYCAWLNQDMQKMK